ncbi:MBOAT family O-acyltransferase [Butyrivibrio sp. LC3010]|uniref:MBOAT family O-acyltransferase n=1 Tax=Butyrivibrio sp. LC3010 TaxID=1280680 RepID=UPI00047ABFB4|nr:MBOAT family O-acyltransferase [Butyrivibrio sp. LC3010]
MIYISLNYYLLVLAALVLYYVFPVRHRWVALLAANVVFYAFFYKAGIWIFLGTIIISYIDANVMAKLQDGARKSTFIAGIILVTIPWLLIKNSNFVLEAIMKKDPINLVTPLGISFYTLQLIAYLADVYMEKIKPEKNIAKYILFTSFFPQVIQGPIPRFGQLHPQLTEGHLFDEKNFVKGFQLVIWGFFLKLVIADKAAVIVNTVFDNFPAYSGAYIWVASFLYSIQLYADFLACTTLARGVSRMFGIELVNNFKRPYFSTSIKDFWRRWHISLSEWLRDYIYIPLGGNRKGKTRKYINLVVTFLISGMWHGAGLKFLAWGLMHALYQIIGEFTYKAREKAYTFCGISAESNKKRWIKIAGTFLLVNFAWIIFRANSLGDGAKLLLHMFTDFNPWVLFNDRIFTLGLDWKEVVVLIVSVYILRKVGKYQEMGKSLGEKIYTQPLLIRWGIYIVAIICVLLFGTYGYGFDAQDFIYGGF